MDFHSVYHRSTDNYCYPLNTNDLIINLCDANNIKRNLLLTIDLINAGFDVMMVVNMHNEICLCDYMRLSNKLGVQIIPLDARNNKHINKLKSILYNYSLNKTKTELLPSVLKDTRQRY